MFSQRHRVLVYAVAVLAGVWALVAVGYVVADHLKVTADKVRAYVESVDLSKLSAADRARALQKLEDDLNALSLEERQHLRMNHFLDRWFQQMTEAEKEAFVESTMPTGIKQMLDAFDQMPPEKRQRAVNNAIKQLREDRARQASAAPTGTNAPPISPELEAKIRDTGLKTYYSQSSAETKAELAPLLEEMQSSMESGRGGHGGP